MNNIFKIILLLAFFNFNSLAGVKTENAFSLKIDQETYISNKLGLLIPESILNLKPGNAIRIYLTDGTFFTGLIKSTELENGSIFKVFGELTNHENAGFGFVLTDKNIFAGAVVIRDKNITYTVKFSEEIKSYFLVKQKSEKISS
jgi:hypothetical protein